MVILSSHSGFALAVQYVYQYDAHRYSQSTPKECPRKGPLRERKREWRDIYAWTPRCERFRALYLSRVSSLRHPCCGLLSMGPAFSCRSITRTQHVWVSDACSMGTRRTHDRGGLHGLAAVDENWGLSPPTADSRPFVRKSGNS